MYKLKVGLVGLGMMGKNHARILSRLDGIDFVGIYDPIFIENSTQQTFGVPKYKELDQLIEQNLDYCVIASPTDTHLKTAIDLLNNGVNCLIEKPITTDYKSAIAIKEIASNKSLVVGIGHIERYNSAIQLLKSKLQTGELGEIFQISTRRQGPFPSRISDVGVVRDLATHDVDLCMWLTNSNFTSVYSKILKKANRLHEDMVSVTGTLSNGSIVNILVNWLNPIKDRNIFVIGETGAFQVNTLNSELTFFRNGIHRISQDSIAHFQGVTQGDATIYAFEKKEPLLSEHENFRNRILGKESKIVSIDEGLDTIRVTDAILRSSELEMEVKI